MTYTCGQAIALMNTWGHGRKPFLFIIDFEMEAIHLFKLDGTEPNNISASFPNFKNAQHLSTRPTDFYFHKYPIPLNDYSAAFTYVKRQIMEGNSFLVNLTFPTRIETNLTLKDIFESSRSKYKLLVDEEFVCFSPETFVTIKNGYIASNPMKGTIKASAPGAMEEILSNSKETAEHYTIVDLIRNDLSMVATDVSVKRFRYIDRIETNEGAILQVSSEITGKLPDNFQNCLGDILFKLLPAGSVTGAPKKKTLEIIRHAEKTKRGYYTGVFGYFDGDSLDSAVMIRFIEKQNNSFWFRSGGGITNNSEALPEYQELIDKVYVPIA